ncbi:MAG: putative Ig domain-containing protein [Deltaproteobacteria bacterium]|nr:putative Ig domain-containing protein [Deltaproteobacteria bacterium]
MMNAPITSSHRILALILTLLTLLALGMAPPVGADYGADVATKMTEIQWKEADLKAAQRELAILNQFLGSYDDKAANLTAARQQLAAADSQLAGIQQNNLVKLTIRMGIETYNTVSDTVSLGKSAAGALVTRGVNSALGTAAMDRLTNGLTDQGRKALGMDAESLSSARTVKIRAVSDAAAAAYPGLARVQQRLGMSLADVKADVLVNEGVELGDTGAILRKNLMVRDEIAAAITKLDAIDTEAAAAKTDADTAVVAAQAEVDHLTAELTALQNELNTLKSQWAESEAAARLAANQALIVLPADLTPAAPPPRQADEEDWEYAARADAAIKAAAQARWNSEAEPLITQIASLKTQIQTSQAEINTAVESTVTNPSVDYFIWIYGGNDTVSADTTASYEGAAGSAAQLETWAAAVAPAEAALPGIIQKVDTLADDYTSLNNLQNRVQSLADLLWEVGLSPPGSYNTAMQVPGMGQEAAEGLSAGLSRTLALLPKALTNAQSQIDQLVAATAAWSSGIGSVRTDIEENLAAAESALAELIARGRAWDNALAAAEGMVVDFAQGPMEARLGYYSNTSFVRVIERAYDFVTYKSAMLAADATPGASGLAAARQLRARYDALVAAAPALKDAFDAARQRFQGAFARLQSYAGAYSLRFPVLEDWSRAAAYNSTAHPVDASGVTDQAARYEALYYTSKQQYTTSLTGGEPVVGQGVLFWYGLPQLHQLPDPGMDDPVGFLPHRLAVAKAVIVEQGPTWVPLAPDQFNTRYSEVFQEVMDLYQVAYDANDGSLEKVMAVMGELGDVQEAYTAAHPKPTITVQPQGSTHSIPAGTTYSGELSVTATGDFMTYKWEVTRWQTDEFGWEEIAGATGRTLTTPALTETRWFRVTVTTPGGSTTSDAAQVQVNWVYPAPVFTSAASASAKVGVPFTWTFTTDIPGAWIFIHGMGLPAWLNYMPMTATLSGTPEAAGTWDINVNASNQGSMTPQTFRLTVAPALRGDIDNSGAVTLADAICALQVCAGITPAAPLNRWGGVNGDGSIGLAEAVHALQEAAALR